MSRLNFLKTHTLLILLIQPEQAEKVDLDEVMVEKLELIDFDELHEKLNISKLTIYELKLR